MDTYETVHTGDVILGGDGQEWGVAAIEGGAVTLTRYGRTVTGYPPASTEVTVLSRADTIEEAQAYEVLAASFGEVSVMGETWTTH